MPSLQAVCTQLAEIAPLRLAESWDNVGLLVGDRSESIDRIMTCLTITPNVVDEAIERKAQLIVAHHPLPFKALQKITTDTVPGSMLLKLMGSKIAIYSAHTAFDSALDGINQKWADALDLQSVASLIPKDPTDATGDGAGRVGKLKTPMLLDDLIRKLAQHVNATAPRRVGNANQSITKVAFACGSGGSFLSAAKRVGCHALITGEATFHTCLEAESQGIGLGLLGHYWSERFAMEQLANRLAQDNADLDVWACECEHDPVELVSDD